MGVQVPPRALGSYRCFAPRTGQIRSSASASLRVCCCVGGCSSVSEDRGGGDLGGGGVVAFEGVGVDLHGHGGVGVAMRCETTLMGTPARSARVAQVWRSPWTCARTPRHHPVLVRP